MQLRHEGCSVKEKTMLALVEDSKEDFLKRDYSNSSFAMGERDQAQI